MLQKITLSDEGLNAAIYAELRRKLVSGRIAPGHGLSTRGIATEMGVSQTPVRDALSRLAAEGAVEIRSKRRVVVPPMTPERFDDLLRSRLLLEPQAAVLALPRVDAERLEQLRECDAALDRAIKEGDAISYMENNHAFHFTIYNAMNRRTMVQLIETLWLQFGPFMRTMYDRLVGMKLNDYHQAALGAIEANDPRALHDAIANDISDGMGLIYKSGIMAAPAI
jgi:DNA-binding GntR family transcriptional regulator